MRMQCKSKYLFVYLIAFQNLTVFKRQHLNEFTLIVYDLVKI